MKNFDLKYPRILAVAPSTRGFGFAVLEGQDTLVNWGVKTVKKDKNAVCLEKIKRMISHYEPDLIILEDASVRTSRRSARIRRLIKQIAATAKTARVRVLLLTREKVRQLHFVDGEGTKHAIAKLIANRFPEELSFRLPPKRKPWMSEDYRMGIFDAVALGLAYRRMRAKEAFSLLRAEKS